MFVLAFNDILMYNIYHNMIFSYNIVTLLEFSSIIIYVFEIIRFYYDVLLCPTGNEKNWYTKWKFNVPKSNNKVKIPNQYTLHITLTLRQVLVRMYFVMVSLFFFTHTKIPYRLTLDQRLTWA